jgi:hypothetical protein
MTASFGRHRLDQTNCDDIAAVITLKRRAGLEGSPPIS